MGLIKHILFHSFWSFLLVLSGIVDIIVSIVLYTTRAQSVTEAPFPIYLISFIVGMLYCAIGVTIAFFQIKKRKEQSGKDENKSDKHQ